MPLFAGYEQQDVQEFLAFLLDAVHEDLNRVPNAERKYVEAKEAKEGESEELVAREAWKGYLEVQFISPLRSPLFGLFLICWLIYSMCSDIFFTFYFYCISKYSISLRFNSSHLFSSLFILLSFCFLFLHLSYFPLRLLIRLFILVMLQLFVLCVPEKLGPSICMLSRVLIPCRRCCGRG